MELTEYHKADCPIMQFASSLFDPKSTEVTFEVKRCHGECLAETND